MSSKVLILGNVGADAELRYMPNGNPVTSFSICSNERGANGDTTQNWFKVNLFGNSAEGIAKHLTKGTSLLVEGRLKPELWKGRDGETRLTMNVNTTSVEFAGGKRAASSASAPEEATGAPGSEIDPDDIPF